MFINDYAVIEGIVIFLIIVLVRNGFMMIAFGFRIIFLVINGIGMIDCVIMMMLFVSVIRLFSF